MSRYWVPDDPQREEARLGESYSARELEEEAERKRQRARGTRKYTPRIATDDERSYGPWGPPRKNPAMKRDWVIIDPDNREKILVRGKGSKPSWVRHKQTFGDMGDQEELRYTTANRAIKAAQRILPWWSRWESVTMDQYIKISGNIRRFGGN